MISGEPYLRFGDILAVNGEPDERRWMVIGWRGYRQDYALLALSGPKPPVVHFSSDQAHQAFVVVERKR